MIFPITFLFVIFSWLSTLSGAGIWSGNLCIEDVFDFTELHLSMARREVFLTEQLISGDEFKEVKDREVISSTKILNQKLVTYNSSGARDFPQGISTDFQKLVKEFKVKNILVAYLCGITETGSFVKIPILKDYDYRIKLGKTQQEYITTTSRDLFLSRGSERSEFTSGDDVTSGDFSFSKMRDFENVEVRRLQGLSPEACDAMKNRSQQRLDSEQELLCFLFSPLPNFAPSFNKFRQYLDDLKVKAGNGNNLRYVSLNLHNRLDSCPVCLYRLHDSFSGLEIVVREDIQNCQFFIMNSSREDYINEGKSRRWVGMSSQESVFSKGINRSQLTEVIEKKQVIQSIVDPFKVYVNRAHKLVSSQSMNYYLDVSEFFSRDINGWTALHVAAQINNDYFHRYLIDRIKSDSQHFINGWYNSFLIRNNDYDTTLHVAINHGNDVFLKVLVENGFPLEVFKNLRGCKGNTLVHTAAASGQNSMIEFLKNLNEMDYHFIIDAKTDEGRTALDLARLNRRDNIALSRLLMSSMCRKYEIEIRSNLEKELNSLPLKKKLEKDRENSK